MSSMTCGRRCPHRCIDLFNDIANDPANAERVNPLMKAYWDGETRSGKKIEYLVRQARIVGTIWRPSDYGKVRAKLISGRVPDDSFYDIKNPKGEYPPQRLLFPQQQTFIDSPSMSAMCQ